MPACSTLPTVRSSWLAQVFTILLRGGPGALEGDLVWVMQMTEIILLSVGLAVSVEDFDGPDFVNNVAAVLGINAQRIAIPTGARRLQDGSSQVRGPGALSLRASCSNRIAVARQLEKQRPSRVSKMI